jgi:hypothetical protein
VSARRLLRLPTIVLLVLAACPVQVSAAAAGVNVRDDAVVLTASDQQTIRDSAARAPFSLYIWTVRGGYTGNKAGFVAAANALMNSDNMVIVAVDTVDKFSHVAARNARLNSAVLVAARASANSSFAKGQWREGVNAAVGRLTNSAGGSRANGATAPGGNGAPGAIQSSFPWVPLIIILLITGAIVVGAMALLRSKQRRHMPGPQDGVGPGYAGAPGYEPGHGGGPDSGGGSDYGRGGG